MIAPYPQTMRDADIKTDVETAFALMEQVVYTIRNIRGEMKLPPSTATDVYLLGDASDPDWKTVEKNAQLFPPWSEHKKLPFKQ